MTTQIEDEYFYDGELFSTIEIIGEGLTDPKEFGLEPFSATSHCWRGMFYNMSLQKTF